MSTFVYDNARSLAATAQLNWPSAGTVKAALMSGAYTPNAHSDVHFSDVPGGAVIITATMSGLAQANGICTGVIPEFDAFLNAATVVGLLFYIDTGDPTTSPLIYYSDEGIGFPFQPLGFNYAVGADLTAGGFFQL